MLRETTSPLCAWDVEGRSEVTLEPGRLLSICRVRQNGPAAIQSGAEAYDVEFEVSGRIYYCPLFRFQPRTQAVAGETAVEDPRTHLSGR